MSTKLGALLFSIQKKEVLLPKLNAFLGREATAVALGKRDARAGVLDDAKMTIACFKERLTEYNHDDPETKDYFHPSQIGQCLRRLWFQQMDAPDNGTASGADMLRQHLVFEIGTYAHVMLQNLIQRAGLLVKREVAVRNDQIRIIGHGDGILKIDGTNPLLEIKTINSNGFSKLLEPKPEHQEQANIYMHELELDTAVFLYYDKNTAQLKEFRTTYDAHLWKNRLLPRILKFHDAVAHKKMPDREGTQPAKFPCTYCEYSGLCFSSNELKNFLAAKKAKGSTT